MLTLDDCAACYQTDGFLRISILRLASASYRAPHTLGLVGPASALRCCQPMVVTIRQTGEPGGTRVHVGRLIVSVPSPFVGKHDLTPVAQQSSTHLAMRPKPTRDHILAECSLQE